MIQYMKLKKSSIKHNLKVSCSTDRLLEIRTFISNNLHSHGYAEELSSELILAVDEVCANSIIHSNNNVPSAQIEVFISFQKESITFEIVDHGIGFDITQYQEPSLNEIINSGRKGGFGLIIVKKIMDEIEFKSEKNTNICKLVKFIDYPSTNKYLSD